MWHIEELPTLEVAGDLSCRQFVGHVLLVEDNAINQLVASDMLEGSGLTFDLAENELEAVERDNQGIHYDLVFMNIQMPVMDGYEATNVIRKNGYDSLVICWLSANAMKMDVDKAMGIYMG
jgi:CheY-like chemotaxis protein